jgi:hypothetical protein
MAATLRITCEHDAPAGLDWANQINKQGRHPVVEIDGEKRPLRWDEPTDVPVTAGEAHHLHVYFEVLGVLRWGGADLDTGMLRDGDTVAVEYLVTLKDRYLDTARLRRVGQG